MIINISKNLWHSQYCTMYIEINPTFDQALAFLILYCMLQLLTTNDMSQYVTCNVEKTLAFHNYEAHVATDPNLRL